MSDESSKVRLRRFSLLTATVFAVATATHAEIEGDGPGGRETADLPSAPKASEVVTSWTIVPEDVNDDVRRWLRRFTGPEKPHFRRWLERQGRYNALIREELRARGMPEDLLYMAMVESGFLPRAYSHAHASGLWQFVDGTARDYGLTVDEWVDERRDPVRATRAALDYLQRLHARFGSWYLAAAAYNAGENRLARILRSQPAARSEDEELFWRVMEHLPRETQEYVPRMIAAAIVGNSPQEYGFDIEPKEPFSFERVFVPAETPLDAVAEAAGVSPRTVADLNPHLLRGATPPGVSYPVRVPTGTAAAVVAGLGDGAGSTLALADD